MKEMKELNPRTAACLDYTTASDMADLRIYRRNIYGVDQASSAYLGTVFPEAFISLLLLN
jgi:hypothetical protein